jgi:arylsulfatase A
MKTRTFPGACAILMACALAAVVSSPAESKTSARPNIVLFLIDDMGWMDSSVYGSTYYETPGMERLAREGMKFTSAYVQPLCSPTRATLMTGKDAPARLHMHQAITGHSSKNPVIPKQARPDLVALWPESRANLPLEETTIAEALKEAGYQTWHLGKWHLGNASQFGPREQGFEKVIGAGGAGPAGGYFSTKVPMLTPGPKGEYICERLTKEAENLLDRRDPNKPFFMYFAHFNVHSPYMAKPELVEHFKRKSDSKNPQNNPVMAAMLRSMDDSLSALLDKLDQLKLTDNTLFVFMSDNGGVHWPNRMQGMDKVSPPTSNLPLRGGKCCFYEGGIRVPMIVRQPGNIKPGTTSDVPVHAVDIYPTFLSHAGASPNPEQVLDGESLAPLFDQSGNLKRDTLYGHFPRTATLAGTMGGSWIRKGDYKLIRLWFAGKDGSNDYELYNLKDDIGEQKNLAAKMPDKVKSMSAGLDKWLAETGALIPLKNPRWNGQPFKAGAARKDSAARE